MDSVRVDEFLRALGCDRIRPGGNMWINATCPLALWKHASGHDNTPSFGISIEPGSASKYKCHACGTSGELTFLVFTLAKYTKRDLSHLLQFLQAHNQLSVSELEARAARVSDEGYWSTRKKVAGIVVQPRAMERNMPVPELQILPESALDSLRDLPSQVMEHLTGPRKLRPVTVRTWELGYHRAADRIAIPIRDCEKALVGISGRAFGDQKPKYLHSSGFRGAFYLYGEDKAVRNARVHLCEGFFDVMYLWQKGYNAVAMQGSSISPFQVEKLKKLFSEVAVVTDGDVAGYKAAEKALSMVGAAMPTSIIKVPAGKDPDQFTDDELVQLLGAPQFVID